MINPGLQKPHCSAPSFAIKAPNSFASSCIPSRVTIRFPSARQPAWSRTVPDVIHQHSTETTVCSLHSLRLRCNSCFSAENPEAVHRRTSRLPFYTIQPESDIHSALPPISSQALLVRTFTRRLLYSFEARMFLSVETCSAAYAAKKLLHPFLLCIHL